MTQGSVHSALSRIEESYCVGDVIIASSAVIGSGVILRADPGCSITIRDGVCIGAGVILHATEGSLEIHQGVCLAGGVLIIGQGLLGQNTCVGAGSTLINPNFANDSIVSSNSLWGDESRQEDPILDSSVMDQGVEISSNGSKNAQSESLQSSESKIPDPWEESELKESKSPPKTEPIIDDKQAQSSHHSAVPTQVSKQVIGIQQFEMMVQKMFPDREAFQKSQQRNQLNS